MMADAYARWLAESPEHVREDREARAGVDRGGMQWFENNGEYPRLFYRAAKPDKNPETGLVTNEHHGVTCNTIEAEDAEQAELLKAEGWHASPADAAEPARRGPGRPRAE